MAKRDVGEAIWETLRSVNEPDSNYEPANVVDGLYLIGRAIYDLAKAVREHTDALTNEGLPK